MTKFILAALVAFSFSAFADDHGATDTMGDGTAMEGTEDTGAAMEKETKGAKEKGKKMAKKMNMKKKKEKKEEEHAH